MQPKINLGTTNLSTARQMHETIDKLEAEAAPEPGQQPSAKPVAVAEVTALKPAAKEDTAGGDNQTTEEIHEAIATKIFAHVASKARSCRPHTQTHSRPLTHSEKRPQIPPDCPTYLCHHTRTLLLPSPPGHRPPLPPKHAVLDALTQYHYPLPYQALLGATPGNQVDAWASPRAWRRPSTTTSSGWP